MNLNHGGGHFVSMTANSHTQISFSNIVGVQSSTYHYMNTAVFSVIPFDVQMAKRVLEIVLKSTKINSYLCMYVQFMIIPIFMYGKKK